MTGRYNRHSKIARNSNNTVPTLEITISPSIKQLEAILNEKHGKGNSTATLTGILEENPSVQSFETANISLSESGNNQDSSIPTLQGRDLRDEYSEHPTLTISPTISHSDSPPSTPLIHIPKPMLTPIKSPENDVLVGISDDEDIVLDTENISKSIPAVGGEKSKIVEKVGEFIVGGDDNGKITMGGDNIDNSTVGTGKLNGEYDINKTYMPYDKKVSDLHNSNTGVEPVHKKSHIDDSGTRLGQSNHSHDLKSNKGNNNDTNDKTHRLEKKMNAEIGLNAPQNGSRTEYSGSIPRFNETTQNKKSNIETGALPRSQTINESLTNSNNGLNSSTSVQNFTGRSTPSSNEFDSKNPKMSASKSLDFSMIGVYDLSVPKSNNFDTSNLPEPNLHINNDFSKPLPGTPKPRSDSIGRFSKQAQSNDFTKSVDERSESLFKLEKLPNTPSSKSGSPDKASKIDKSASPQIQLLGTPIQLNTPRSKTDLNISNRKNSLTLQSTNTKDTSRVYPVKSMLDASTKSNASRKSTESSIRAVPNPIKPPHQRSFSTFTVNNIDKEENKRQRSNTVGGISSTNDSNTEQKKKFSFRSMFKSKSKSYGLSDDTSSENSRKVASKSYSVPNIAQLTKQADPPQNTTNTKPKRASVLMRFRTKSNDNIAGFFDNKSKKLKPLELTSQPVEAVPEINVNDESQHTVSVTSTQIQKEASKFDSPKSHSRSFPNNKSKAGSNLFDDNIKPGIIDDDIDDDDLYNRDNYSDGDVSDEYQYDTKNLTVHPPKKQFNKTLGEEILISPSYQTDFGSPFKVNYTGSPKITPKISIDHDLDFQDTLANLSFDSSPTLAVPNSRLKEDKLDLLSGEALFPKSLSAQEVESIVSLERSRSMRSIKSNKRSSYVNYQGSDENIVQYTGPPPSSPTPSGSIKRSSSILKNSGSTNNIDEELVNHSFVNGISINAEESSNLDDSIRQHYESINYSKNDDSLDDDHLKDLIEFTDFIDVDNLSFIDSPLVQPDETFERSISPISIAEDYKPKLLANSNHSLSKEIHEDTTEEISDAPKAQIKKIDTKTESNDTYEDLSEITTSPILNRAIENSPLLNENGKSTFNNRPISMSFRGTKGSSYGKNLTAPGLRSSESHQSFNISLDDDTDYSGSGVGGGFGSSDDEASDDFYKKPINVTKLNRFDNNSATSLVRPPNLNIISGGGSSIASSPRSFGSMISKTWKKASIGGNHVRFSSRIILYDTYNGEEYDRYPDTGTCNQLTPQSAQQIKDELNSFKCEMEIHAESQQYTHFF